MTIVNDEARDNGDIESLAEHIALTGLSLVGFAVLGAVLLGAGYIGKSIALVAEAHAEAGFIAEDAES